MGTVSLNLVFLRLEKVFISSYSVTSVISEQLSGRRKIWFRFPAQQIFVSNIFPLFLTTRESEK